VSQSGISLCCTKKQPDAYGFRFSFYKGPPLDFDVINAAKFQLPLREILKLKCSGKTGLPKNDLIGNAALKAEAQLAQASYDLEVTFDADDVPLLAEIPRDALVSAGTIAPGPLPYRIRHPDGRESTHFFPSMVRTPPAVSIAKPQLSLASHKERSGRLLVL
jgi:hypothetical protein